MTDTGLRVAIVADDLTGAMDAAAPFARRGLNVQVLTSPDDVERAVFNTSQVLSINSATRHFTPENAFTVVNNLVSTLVKCKPELVVKKIDSTLRGNVVAETAAAMQATGYQEVLICPAVPSQGRTFRCGELYINDIPLAQTSIGRDLRSPPSATPLRESFQTLKPEISVLHENIDTLYAAKDSQKAATIRIIDAESDNELLTLARLALEQRGATLFVGASGLTEALAELFFGPGFSSVMAAPLAGINLFVVGSQAPQARLQAETLQARDSNIKIIDLSRAEPLTEVQLENIAADYQDDSALVLRAPQGSAEIIHDPDQLAMALADSAAKIMAYVPVGLLLATGGDTALAIIKALNVRVIRVCGEVQPGVVHSLIELERGSLRLVTKAGGFGDENLFSTVRGYFQ
ncbi:MAG: four-carbon acid sugar kinase family protein [Desulfobacterales bacterium]|nr:four-carbon acid sugar kinase family protein [Desulfobacterales bacterium]